MTHAQKAAEKINERISSLSGHQHTLMLSRLSELIQTHAIKPAVDEATRELKLALQLVVTELNYICHEACKEISEFQMPIQTQESITAAEKLLEK